MGTAVPTGCYNRAVSDMRLLGIDLGTGSTKAAVVDEHLEVRGFAAARHAVSHPRPAAAESDPHDWLRSVAQAVDDALHAGRCCGRTPAPSTPVSRGSRTTSPCASAHRG